jgi:hypothetical protein
LRPFGCRNTAERAVVGSFAGLRIQQMLRHVENGLTAITMTAASKRCQSDRWNSIYVAGADLVNSQRFVRS